jgi:hypothetical protein
MPEETIWQAPAASMLGLSIVRGEDGDCELVVPDGHRVCMGRVVLVDAPGCFPQAPESLVHRLSVRVTAREYEEIASRADAACLRLSDYVRTVLLAQPRRSAG